MPNSSVRRVDPQWINAGKRVNEALKKFYNAQKNLRIHLGNEQLIYFNREKAKVFKNKKAALKHAVNQAANNLRRARENYMRATKVMHKHIPSLNLN